MNWSAIAAGYKIGSDIADRRRETQQREAFSNFAELLSQDTAGMGHEEFKQLDTKMREILPSLGREDAIKGATFLRNARDHQRANTYSTAQKLYRMGDTQGMVDFLNARNYTLSAKNQIVVKKLIDGIAMEEVAPNGQVRSSRYVPNDKVDSMLYSLRHGLEGGAKQEAEQERADRAQARADLDTESKITQRQHSMDMNTLRSTASAAASHASAALNQQRAIFDAERQQFARNKEERAAISAEIEGIESRQKELRGAQKTIRQQYGAEVDRIDKLEKVFGDDVTDAAKLFIGVEGEEADEIYSSLTSRLGKARADQAASLAAARKRVAAMRARMEQLTEVGSRPAAIPQYSRQTGVVNTGAPQAAINALRQNPSLAPQFKAKYGYLPPGM